MINSAIDTAISVVDTATSTVSKSASVVAMSVAAVRRAGVIHIHHDSIIQKLVGDDDGALSVVEIDVSVLTDGVSIAGSAVAVLARAGSAVSIITGVVDRGASVAGRCDAANDDVGSADVGGGTPDVGGDTHVANFLGRANARFRNGARFTSPCV